MKLQDNTKLQEFCVCIVAGALLKDRFVLDMSKTEELIYLINVPNPNNSTTIQILN